VPWKITVVSSASLDRSSVVPEGTATLFKTIVAQEACDLLAAAAPAEPEKVQLVARLATASGWGAGVIAGAGAAATDAANDAVNATTDRKCILRRDSKVWCLEQVAWLLGQNAWLPQSLYTVIWTATSFVIRTRRRNLLGTIFPWRI